MKAKPWQIWLIVIGLLVGIGSMIYSFTGSQELKLPHRVHLIDVESGQIYEVDTTKYKPVLPALKPGTERRTLLPVEKTGEKWFVPRHWLSEASDMPKDVQFKAVDRETGDLTAPPLAPTKYTPPTWD